MSQYWCSQAPDALDVLAAGPRCWGNPAQWNRMDTAAQLRSLTKVSTPLLRFTRLGFILCVWADVAAKAFPQCLQFESFLITRMHSFRMAIAWADWYAVGLGTERAGVLPLDVYHLGDFVLYMPCSHVRMTSKFMQVG